MTGTEKEFHEAMLAIYDRCRDECEYRPTRFLNKVRRVGGVRTARDLLSKRQPEAGLTRLAGLERLDLTVEAHVLMPKFAALFTRAELDEARHRLESFGWSRR